MGKRCFTCKECYCVEPKDFIHMCKKRMCGVEPNHTACKDYNAKEDCKDKRQFMELEEAKKIFKE